MLEFLKGLFLVLYLFLLHINDLPDDIICNIAIYAFNAGKTKPVLLDRSKNTCAIDVKMDGSVLEEKTSFKMLGLTFSFYIGLGLLHCLYC